MKKVIIVNAHWSNRGDEAAIRVYIDKLLNETYSLQIIFKDDYEVQQFPYEGVVKYTSSKFLPSNFLEWLIAIVTKGALCKNVEMRRTIEIICEADVIIYAPGGAVISDRFWWRKQMEYLTPFLCSRIFHISMFVAAPSMGPFDITKKFRNLVRKNLLNNIKCLCVREDISRKYLMNIGVSKNVCVTIDSAFYNEIDARENEAKLIQYQDLKYFLDKYETVIGITITDLSWHVEWNKSNELKDKIENTFKSFIKEMCEREVGVILIPQLFGNQNDSIILEKFQLDNTFLLSNKMDAYFQQYLISKLYMVVGMRYHSNIFAAKMAVPFIAVAYEEKMTGFMEMAGLKEYLILLDKLSTSTLMNTFEKLNERYDVVKKFLENKKNEWKNQAEKTMNCLQDILKY